MAKLPRKLSYRNWPIPKDGTVSDQTMLQWLGELMEMLKNPDLKICLFSSEGHGRAGLVASALLGIIYLQRVRESAPRNPLLIIFRQF